MTISFLRDPAGLTDWEAGEALRAFYLADATGDPDENLGRGTEDNGRFHSSVQISVGIQKKEIRLSDACELAANNHIFRTTLPLFSSAHEDSVLADMRVVLAVM